MNESCVLGFEQAATLCQAQTGYAYDLQMFQEVEIQLLSQFNYNLNIPTAHDLLLQIIYLEQDKGSNFVGNGPGEELKQQESSI